jgi:hypothetical protein
LQGCNDSDPSGQEGKRTFSIALEKAFFKQSLFERLEGESEGSSASGFDAGYLQLESAATFVDSQLSPAANELSVAKSEL